MPDNEKNVTPDKDIGNTMSDLSEKISLAKKKMEQEAQDGTSDAAVQADSAKKPSEKPDISFAKNNDRTSPPAPAEKKQDPTPEKKVSSPKPVQAAKPDVKPANKTAAANERPADKKPAAQAPKAAAKPANGQPPKRPGPPPKRRPPQPGANRGTAARGERPPAANGKPVRQGAKQSPASGTSPNKAANNKPAEKRPDRPAAASRPAKPETANKKRETANKKPNTAAVTPAAEAALPSGKGRFTKKQIATVTGLAVGLLILLALVILLLFHHYAGLFDKSKQNINNSDAMTYSDVDFSRADTMDTVTADQKLKELRQKAEPISNKDVMNILLIGEDLRDTQSEENGNTDVMMIISVNKKDKTITETSIMRDCYIYFEEFGYSTRINAAYWHGGIDYTQKIIEEYMGIKIDRYVLVNFKVFIDIVDTLGGLDLTVTDEEANGYPGADPNGDNTRGMQNPLDEQNKYLGNKKGTDYIKKGGDLHLNGNQALAYARLRHVGNSDYDRTARQRKVIKEMIKKSKKLSIIEMDKLANKIFPQIKTDLTEGEMAQMLIELLDYRNYKVQEFRVPMDNTYTNEVISGMDVLIVDFYTNSEMFKKKVYGSIKTDEEGNEAKNIIE